MTALKPTDPAYIGRLCRVVGSKLLVSLSPDIESMEKTIQNEKYWIGQIGSFLKIPLEGADLFGVVTATGEWGSDTVNGGEGSAGEGVHGKWVETQLVGESDRKGTFLRGVSQFPTIENEVYLATHEEIALIYGHGDERHLAIGKHSTAKNLTAFLNFDKLISRHGVIVGSTGSGKSNAVAHLLKTLTDLNFPSSQIVLIDPHGEYESVLKDKAKVFSVRHKTNPLLIPYWALSFDELAWFLVDRQSSTESQQDKILRDKIYEEKQKARHRLKAGAIDENFMTPDSPVPFDLKKIWYELYHMEHATYWDKNNLAKIAYKPSPLGSPMKGSAEDIAPPVFELASTGGNPPYPSPTKSGLAVYLNKIMIRLKDRTFDFLLNPDSYDGTKKDLSDLVESWLGHDKPVTILNLDGVPFEILDLVVGVVTRIIFQTMYWSRNLPGMGRQRPLLMVFEEAHGYLSRTEHTPFVSGYARMAVRRVFKEGRKYGVGGIVISQRPSELDPMVLAEAGTFMALRLTNEEDRRRVSQVFPDTLAGLADFLPGLKTGEAILTGEAVQIPSFVHLPLIEPRPNSKDSEAAKQWREPRVAAPPYKEAVTAWRKQQLAE